MINLCVTTTTRQDLLPGMLRSAFAGSLRPDHVMIIDQNPVPGRLDAAFSEIRSHYDVITFGPDQRGSEAAAINCYLRHVPEERVIAHEDVVFGRDSLERFVAHGLADFKIDCTMGVMSYSDRCRDLVGYYDEFISPNFYLYADVDYEDRLALAGIHPVVVDCGITHLGSASWQHTEEYVRRAERARANYEAKWGRKVTPGGNTIGRGNYRQAEGAAQFYQDLKL